MTAGFRRGLLARLRLKARVSCSVRRSGQDVGWGGQAARIPAGATLFRRLDRHLLDQLHDAPAQLRARDPHERLDERQPVIGGEKIGDVAGGWRFLQSRRVAGRRWSALEEERHRHLEDEGDLLQPARTDAIGALLVFLDLLKRQAKRIAQLLLTHAQHHAPHAHAAPDVLVDRIGGLFGHAALPGGNFPRDATSCTRGEKAMEDSRLYHRFPLPVIWHLKIVAQAAFHAIENSARPQAPP